MFLTTSFPLLRMYRISYLGLVAKCFRGSLGFFSFLFFFLHDLFSQKFGMQGCSSPYSVVFS